MFTDISALFAADGEKSFDINFNLSVDEPSVGLINAKGKIVSHATVVELEGEADFDYTRQCDRCAEEITKNMKVKFFHTLVTECTDEDDVDTIEVHDKKIDLEEVIHEDVVLSLPVRFLCKEECKGLCIECGKNLNEGECGCVKNEPDGPFAALKELL